MGRINIVEPDGTKRMVISNKAQFPGDFHQGQEGNRPDRRSFAGMIFINEEGTENGGLIQKGSITPDGNISSGLSLTFDRFRQDQALQLLNNDSAAHQQTAVIINDIPHFKVTSLEINAVLAKRRRNCPWPSSRPIGKNCLSKAA